MELVMDLSFILLIYASHCAEHYTCIISFSPAISHIKYVFSPLAFYSSENRGLEKLTFLNPKSW